MASAAEIARIWAPVARAIHTPMMVEHWRRSGLAIANDGQILPAALRQALPRQVATWFISGTQTVANNLGLEYPVPQAGEVERITASVKTAPVGSDLIVQIRRNGVAIGTVNIPDGTKTGAANVDSVLDAGDTLVVDVLQIGSGIGTPGSNLSVGVVYRAGGD